MKIKAGWLEQAKQLPSSFFNARPKNIDIDLIVIHAISLPPGEFGSPYIDQLFTGNLDVTAHEDFRTLVGMEVSAHVLIDRQGALTQYVSFENRAWHAGVSSFQGKENCNDFSIGIELEGADGQPFTSIQYDILAGLLQDLMIAYPRVTRDRIIGHSDIAPGRKTDPGPNFDWQYLRELLRG